MTAEAAKLTTFSTFSLPLTVFAVLITTHHPSIIHFIMFFFLCGINFSGEVFIEKQGLVSNKACLTNLQKQLGILILTEDLMFRPCLPLVFCSCWRTRRDFIWDLTNPEMVTQCRNARVWLTVSGQFSCECFVGHLDLLQVYQPVSGAPLASFFCFLFNLCMILYIVPLTFVYAPSFLLGTHWGYHG